MNYTADPPYPQPLPRAATLEQVRAGALCARRPRNTSAKLLVTRELAPDGLELIAIRTISRRVSTYRLCWMKPSDVRPLTRMMGLLADPDAEPGAPSLICALRHVRREIDRRRDVPRSTFAVGVALLADLRLDDAEALLDSRPDVLDAVKALRAVIADSAR